MKYVPLLIFTIILTIVVWLLQIAAIAAGIAFWMFTPLWVGYLLALFFGWIPPFAPLFATIAAVQVWGWNWLVALLVFFGIYILYVVLFIQGIFGVYKGVKWARGHYAQQQAANYYPPEHDDPTIIDQ